MKMRREMKEEEQQATGMLSLSDLLELPIASNNVCKRHLPTSFSFSLFSPLKSQEKKKERKKDERDLKEERYLLSTRKTPSRKFKKMRK